jgi:hypothetical protein
MPLIGVFDDEGDFRVSLRDPLPATDAVNRRGIVTVDDDKCGARMIIHVAEVMRLGGAELGLRRRETQVMSFRTASIVELDERGFVRGRYRSQRPCHGRMR